MRLIDRIPPTVRSAEDLLLDFERTGDSAPFEEIVRRYSAMVYGVCYRVTRNAHDAEDSTQAVFLKLALQARTTNGIPRVGPWLQRVAKTTAMDLRRSRTRRSNREFIRAEMNSRDEADVESADDAVRMDEIKVLLRAEVDELPPNYRTPLILYYFGGLSTDEIAKELGSNAKALAVRLFRGRQMLAGRLKERGVGSGAETGVMMKVAVGDAILAALADAVLVPAGARRMPQSMMVTMTSGAAASLAARICAVTRACLNLPRSARWGLGALLVLSLSSVAGSQTRFADQPVGRHLNQWLQGMRRVMNLISQATPAEVAPVAAKPPVKPVDAVAKSDLPVLMPVPAMPQTAAVQLAAVASGMPVGGQAVTDMSHLMSAAVRSTAANMNGGTPAAKPASASNASYASADRGPAVNGISISATRSLLAMRSSGSTGRTFGAGGAAGTTYGGASSPHLPGAAEPDSGPTAGAVATAGTNGAGTAVDPAPINIASPTGPNHASGTAPVASSGGADGTDGSSVLSGDGTLPIDHPPTTQPNIGSDVAPGTAAPIQNANSPVPEPAGLAVLGAIGLLLSRRRRR